jgi:predicted acylesterase/phospholipase RssA
MSHRDLLDIRKPLVALEGQLIQRMISEPDALPGYAVDAVRYALSLARLTLVRNRDGQDVDLSETLARHRWWVQTALEPRIRADEHPLRGVMRLLPELTAITIRQRDLILEHFPIDRDSLEEELCTRQLVVVSGGGGGSGYGYAGAYALLHRGGLQPRLLAGTSIGALASLFRARREVYDSLPVIEAARRLRWNNVFEVLNVSSRYGVPATLRLYLRRSLGSLMLTADGQPITFRNAEIPLLIVATGIKMEGLKHDLSYYEHYLDDVVRPGVIFRASKLRRLQGVVSLMGEFVENPDALREVVFGRDPMTLDADALDAAGFSSAVPGLIHYDVIRDDPRMKTLLDGLYAEYGITRLGEGGLVNNVPAKPAFEEVMDGRLGRRNPFVLAMDCFVPRPRSLGWYPIQQIAARTVKSQLPYIDLYVPLERVLSPASVVPTVRQLTTAMAWTTEELTPMMPFIQGMCAAHPVLRDSPESLSVSHGGHPGTLTR